MRKSRFTSILALVLCLMLCAPAASLAYEAMVPENGQTYPLSDSKLNLSFWYPNAGSLGELPDYNDGEFWKWYEEKTNIHVDFEVAAVNTETNAFQLLFADTMPDIVYSYPPASGGAGQAYRAGEDKAIEDGYFIDLAQYLDLAPNYSAWLEKYPEFKKAAYTDTGKMYGFWGVWLPMYETVQADQGLAIRKDFLDKVGLEAPKTYDDWYNALVAFRDQLGIEAPFYTSKYGIDQTGEFMAGFDTAPYFYQRDGKIAYGPLDDQYRDYLIMLNKWWNEGLLDKDFATRASTGITADNDMMLNDKVGSLVDFGTRLSETYVTRGASNPEFYLIGLTQPVKQEGDTPKYRQYAAGNNMLTTVAVSISAESEHIEEAIRWVDGFYAEDVYLNANYGLEEQEGVVWYADPTDGHRIGDYDFRYANPNGTSSATVLVQYWTKNPPVRVEAAQIEQADQNKQDAYKIWSTFEPTAWIPSRITLTSDEGTEFASLYTDIETYVQECNVKFIMGQMSLDEYDAYRDTLRKMNIDRCIELRQAALDRFNAR
jgi:hypothetical protein